NTASVSLLKYVSGISSRIASNIIKYREQNGKFSSRNELLKVKGIGNKTFTQCAGFLRIPEGDNILDNTAVHPESYSVAEELLNMNFYEKDIKYLSRKLNVGYHTLKDII